MRIGETNTPNDVLWTEQDVYFSSLKNPTNIYPTRLSSLSQHSFQSKIWQYIGRFLTWHSQLTSIWPILNLEGASARLGSVRPLKPVTPEHTSRLCWHTGSSQKAQHQTPVFNSTSRGRLPRCIDGLSMNAYFTSQCHSSRCGARLLQSYRSSALRLHATRHLSCTCRITKRTKTNTDLYSTIESEGHTYLLEYSPKSLPATQLPWTSR